MIPLHEGEQILAVRRKSWFIFASTSATAGALMLVPIILGLVLSAPKLEILYGARLSLFVLGAAIFEWIFWIWLFISLINY